jgi:hypothetical protein
MNRPFRLHDGHMRLRLLAAALGLLLLAQPARAATMAIGLNSWFNWWEIPTENMEQHYVTIDFSVIPTFLFGPMLSFQITPRWNLSSLFMFGNYQKIIDFDFSINYFYEI